MTEKPVFSDQDLSAYLDGEAPAAVTKAIGAALPNDAALRARLSELRAGQNQFTSAMQSALDAAPDMPRLPPARSEQTAPSWRIQSACGW